MCEKIHSHHYFQPPILAQLSLLLLCVSFYGKFQKKESEEVKKCACTVPAQSTAMETASKRRITILVLCAIGFLLIMLIYALGKEAELTGKIQSGYHVVVSANGSRLIHSRRNMTKYSMRFAKERKAKNIMTIMKNSIYSKWAIRQFPLFLSSMYIPTDSWLTLKYKFVDLLIENESKNASKYVIGFIGSAETFGSGTGANQSYPLLIENALSPLFSTVGTKLEVYIQNSHNNLTTLIQPA